MFKKSLLCLFLCCISSVCFACGPKKVATIDRTTWPMPITDTHSFNTASQAEILRFVEVISATPLNSADDITTLTNIKKNNVSSVAKWLTATKKNLLDNYQHATESKTLLTWSQLSKQATDNPWRGYNEWYSASGQFYTRYLYEQVRLAALFPRIPSEIGTFSANELTGSSFKDGEFLLTFDDGPSAKYTQSTINALDKINTNGFFFILGSKLEKFSDTNIYASQCLGSHGWKHKSHKTIPFFTSSYQKTANTLKPLQKEPVAFRPPYGVRTELIAKLAKQKGINIVLWNIDSQDWNRKLTTKQVTDRVTTLMLLWRRGIILFHDIHPKAQKALPTLDSLISSAGFNWKQCTDF